MASITLIALTLALVRNPAIPAFHVGDRGPRVLVVGCVHGDECAGAALVDALRRLRPRRVQLWLVPTLNPVGRRLGRRGNEHGVDLNRNFGAGWRAAPRGPWSSGPAPWSEPETRFARALILRVRPDVTIWFHQPQGLVRAWGRSVGAARRYARLAALPFRALRWPAGSATRWQNGLAGGGSSFVVELPPGRLGSAAVRRHVRAVLRVAAQP